MCTFLLEARSVNRIEGTCDERLHDSGAYDSLALVPADRPIGLRADPPALAVSEDQPNNPLHGVTLKAILEALVERHGWPELATRIKIRCFSHDPSISSSLTFLRKTDWARKKVEQLYLRNLARKERRRR